MKFHVYVPYSKIKDVHNAKTVAECNAILDAIGEEIDKVSSQTVNWVIWERDEGKSKYHRDGVTYLVNVDNIETVRNVFGAIAEIEPLDAYTARKKLERQLEKL